MHCNSLRHTKAVHIQQYTYCNALQCTAMHIQQHNNTKPQCSPAATYLGGVLVEGLEEGCVGTSNAGQHPLGACWVPVAARARNEHLMAR